MNFRVSMFSGVPIFSPSDKESGRVPAHPVITKNKMVKNKMRILPEEAVMMIFLYFL
jgi:hypothetical protein